MRAGEIVCESCKGRFGVPDVRATMCSSCELIDDIKGPPDQVLGDGPIDGEIALEVSLCVLWIVFCWAINFLALHGGG